MHKFFFIETKLGEAALTWYKQESFDGYSEFVSKITLRFVNPDRERLTDSCLNDLRYRKDHVKYIAECSGLIDSSGERKLSDNVYSLLCPVPENMQLELYINEQNLS
jgi:hypothetical protein